MAPPPLISATQFAIVKPVNVLALFADAPVVLKMNALPEYLSRSLKLYLYLQLYVSIILRA